LPWKILQNVFSEFFPNLNLKNFGKLISKFLYKSKNGKTGVEKKHGVGREKFFVTSDYSP
jgi:hypothetical protein